MRLVQARFITACQQLLALGVVLAVLTPASGVISLDIVGQHPGAGPAGGPAVICRRAALGHRADRASSSRASPRSRSRPAPATPGRWPARPWSAARSTSNRGDQPAPGRDGLRRRRRHLGARRGAGRGPDRPPGPHPRGRRVERLGRPRVPRRPRPRRRQPRRRHVASRHRPADHRRRRRRPDQGQRATTPSPTTSRWPSSSPGRADATESETPAAGGEAAERRRGHVVRRGVRGARRASPGSAGEITLQAARKAAQPTIFTRAQWGADESIRNKSALRYGSISAGFVHHTVNANDYTEAQVPGIIRSIYAYHVKSRGWSDIGYNFLVDRFGRIWEGRYGGIDKAVVGAHTLGYNDYSFAMSAIGNFDVVQPPEVMLQAYGALFAWKLGLHGVNPASMSQQVGQQDVPGHQRPPRRRLDRLPRPLPLRQARQHPGVRRRGRHARAAPPPPAPTTVEIGDPGPAVQPRGRGVPRPRRPPGRRRPRPDRPHRRPDGLREGDRRLHQGLDRQARRPRHPRRHR